MKKNYSKKQITEAIAYWQKQLKKLNESSSDPSRTVRHLKEQIDKLSQSDLDKEFIFTLDNEIVYTIARDVCEVFGIKMNDDNYKKIDDEILSPNVYTYGISDISLHDYKGDIAIQGCPEWTNCDKY